MKKGGKLMIKDNFELRHDNGRLYAEIYINNTTFEMDVTEYFENDNPHDEWLDYRLKLNK